jgi:DNA-binding GntR family transcriptional regulator
VAERVARIHLAILEAIAARDSDLARARMVEHLDGLSGGNVGQTAARLVASV